MGLERAIPNASTIWQVEQDTFCQKVLQKHWPKAQIFDDVRTVGKHNLQPVDILCGGFPCQDISVAGKQKGVTDGKKSGLWWEMHRIIGELSQGPKKPIVVLENVPNIVRLGGREVLGSLAQLGYDAEWGIISAGGSQGIGAPHLRRRWFCVAYPNRVRCMEHKRFEKEIQQPRIQGIQREESQQPHMSKPAHRCDAHASNAHNTSTKNTLSTRREKSFLQSVRDREANYWQKTKAPPALCNVDDGIPNRLARIKALGNAIVPQCSQYIGEYIYRSGLI